MLFLHLHFLRKCQSKIYVQIHGKAISTVTNVQVDLTVNI